MNDTIKDEIIEHLNHWKDVPNGVVASKVFEALRQKENRNKDEYNIEDICKFVNVKILDDSASVLGALVIMSDQKSGFLNMYQVYKDTNGKEFKLDFRNHPIKHKYGTNDKGLSVLEMMEHPETGEVIHYPENSIYLRFSLSDKFKAMLLSEESTLKTQPQKKTTPKP